MAVQKEDSGVSDGGIEVELRVAEDVSNAQVEAGLSNVRAAVRATQTKVENGLEDMSLETNHETARRSLV